MAKTDAVWGIDIGQSALKALRCTHAEEGDKQIVATAFDFIEYPQILSQPEANAAELVHEALTQFLSRNSVQGDKIVISVSGQSGLARFIKLPPVESSKIPDIVKYEAKQQIPFPLEEVVWDYQTMGGGSFEEGFALETEVGLFAMKRDTAYRALEPFQKVDVEVDTVQLTPLALYNYLVFDQIRELPPAEEYDPDNPPDSIVLLSMGTDTTDLVVTNGFRVWQRSIPVGGNHFTKALTKELKLNFSTAEHLKRNAAQAEDPKALFQAMRPVFNDLLTEVQRSLGYFKNMDKRANISRVLALGNVMKLPGLQRYLTQNLGFELTKVDKFAGLSGTGIVDAPAFKENMLAFGVSYGLALQGLGQSQIHTNLLPREISQDRLIRSKKPWAVAAAALLLLGCGISYFKLFSGVESVSIEPNKDGSFHGAIGAAKQIVNETNELNQKFDGAKQQFVKQDAVGRSMLQNMLGRDTWAEVLKSINLCLPRNEGERPEDIAQRNEIKIDAIESTWVPDLSVWYAGIKDRLPKPEPPKPATAEGADPANPIAEAPPVEPPPEEPAPTGPGWVIQLRGHHYHNADLQNSGNEFVKNTLLKNLRQDEVPLPENMRTGGQTTFPVKKLGLRHPVLLEENLINQNFKLNLPDAAAPVANPMGAPAAPVKVKVQPRLDFVVQFCWQPRVKSSSEAPSGDAASGQVAAQ